MQEARNSKLSRINGERIYRKKKKKKEQNTLSISRINFSKRAIGLQALNNSRECSKGEHVFNLKRGKTRLSTYCVRQGSIYERRVLLNRVV